MISLISSSFNSFDTRLEFIIKLIVSSSPNFVNLVMYDFGYRYSYHLKTTGYFYGNPKDWNVDDIHIDSLPTLEKWISRFHGFNDPTIHLNHIWSRPPPSVLISALLERLKKEDTYSNEAYSMYVFYAVKPMKRVLKNTNCNCKCISTNPSSFILAIYIFTNNLSEENESAETLAGKIEMGKFSDVSCFRYI